ncbi:IclR family transcriptional regulator domain-containing protein [Streptomyces eurythermus]|uniref:IclR family transcriptional regulator domain-containing protein n=1 Tax=Streptomyces eurythermus TaxID=42237 RepID=UPI003407CADF
MFNRYSLAPVVGVGNCCARLLRASTNRKDTHAPRVAGPGVCCAAVPVRRHGRVVAALGVSGPASRLPQDRLRELAITASHLLTTEGIG